MTWKKEVDVCYCVVKNLELSIEYFGRYCKKLLNQFFFNSFQDIQLYASVPSWYGRRHCILSLWSFLTLQCISKWGNGDFLFGWIWPFWPAYHALWILKLTRWKKWIYAKKLELSSEYFGGYCKKLLNQFLFYSLPRHSIVSFSSFMIW